MIARTITFSLLTALAAAPVAAQEGAERGQAAGSAATAEGVPDGWMMRLDRLGAGPAAVDFRTMEPGWHVTTGGAGAAIFWQPAMTASGAFDLRARMHLMKPAEHPEAFGLFVGGEDLGAADQSYLYFLVRQTGEYLIKRRQGDETETVVGWTRHPASPVATTDGTTDSGSTAYDLEVDVREEQVVFTVNGTTVETLPAADLQTDGTAGVRINHRLDIHVEALELDQGA